MGQDQRVTGRLVAGAGAGGAMLMVSVFLPWYSLSLADVLRGAARQLSPQVSDQVSGAFGSIGLPTLTWSGWHSVHVLRFVLLLVGVLMLLSSLGRPTTAPATGRPWLLLAGGLVATALTAYRIMSPPSTLDISVGPFQLPTPPGVGDALSHLLQVNAGAWVALIGGGLAMLGGWSQFPSARTAKARLSVPPAAASPASTPPPGTSSS